MSYISSRKKKGLSLPPVQYLQGNFEKSHERFEIWTVFPHLTGLLV